VNLVIAGGLAIILIALAISAWAVWMVRSVRRHEAELQQRLAELEQKTLPIPGIDQGEKRWALTIGGNPVEIHALPPAEWARALQDLPDFLFSYALAKQGGGSEGMKAEELEKLTARARDWIAASIVDTSEGVRPDLDHLTVPEAMDAVVRISRLNGLDENLAAWFRSRGSSDAAASGRDREAVRGKAKRAAGPRPN